MNREIMDVISLEEFKEILSGDPTGTVTIDEEEFQTYERTNAEETYRAVLYIDDRKRARRFSDFGRNDEGEWIIREMNELHYDVEMDESIFTPNFGENVSIKEPDLILKEEFALDRAVVTREEFGLVFALHELKRCKNGYVYVVCSIRPTEETIRELGPPNDNIWSGYGDLRMMNSWRRTEDAELLYYYHSHHLADARFHGLSVTWDVLTRPEDSWPLALENCVLSAYIHSRGRLEKKFTNRGEPYYRKFNPLLTVPLPTEEVSFSDVIARMHSRMLPLESAEGQVSLLLGHEPLDEPEHLRPITRLPRQISAEEFERISRERIEPSE